jgi:YQGE family putative transporter
MYGFGMVSCSFSMAFMMYQKELDIGGVAVAGLVMGLSYGFFWANRTFMALTSTKKETRNYFYGTETFLTMLALVTIPFLAGSFIGLSKELSWFGGNINGAYYVLNGFVFILSTVAFGLVRRGQFPHPGKAPFLFIKFHPLWRKMLRMSALKGLAQGYIITAPVMLILRLVGEEGALGGIQSAGALLSATLLYFLGRKTNPSHRMKIFSAGLFLFLLGSITNAALYSAEGVIFFVACLVFSRPLLDLAYFPIQLGVIELVKGREKRSAFAYIFSHELGLFTGRLFGCGLFIALARFVSEDAALRYALPVIALVQFLSVFVAKSIVNDRAWHEPKEEDIVAVEVLKKPVTV